LSLPTESGINNKCEIFGDFGEQGINILQKKSGEFKETGVGQIFYNKYIFSPEIAEGKNFYLFSKPFEFPFKIADLIFLTSSEDKYCFSSAPDQIKEELSSLGQGNIFTENCPDESINICFSSGSNCDITVNRNQKSVEKDGFQVYYETDSLMYGAIFSDPEIYECQVERLMKRLRQLALIYNEKEDIISAEGCLADVNLLSLADAASALSDSSDLILVKPLAEDADRENNRAYCELW